MLFTQYNSNAILEIHKLNINNIVNVLFFSLQKYHAPIKYTAILQIAIGGKMVFGEIAVTLNKIRMKTATKPSKTIIKNGLCSNTLKELV